MGTISSILGLRQTERSWPRRGLLCSKLESGLGLRKPSSKHDGIQYLFHLARGEAIYDTQYWYVTAEEGDLRFVSHPSRSLYAATEPNPDYKA